MPFMDETPITEQTFIDFEFVRVDIPREKNEPKLHYYEYDFGNGHYLFSEEDSFDGVQLGEGKTWKTVGELKLLFMLFLEDK